MEIASEGKGQQCSIEYLHNYQKKSLHEQNATKIYRTTFNALNLSINTSIVKSLLNRRAVLLNRIAIVDQRQTFEHFTPIEEHSKVFLTKQQKLENIVVETNFGKNSRETLRFAIYQRRSFHVRGVLLKEKDKNTVSKLCASISRRICIN